MKVVELLEFIRENDIPDDAEVNVALFIGPGSPTAKVYDVVRLRKSGMRRGKDDVWVEVDVYDM